MKKAYDDYKTVLDADQLKTMQNAEDAVNNLVEVSITYLDYCNKAIVMTPNGASDDLKSALSDLQKKYKTLEDAREALEDASKTVQIYAQFALLGELDKEEKNLSTLSSAIYKTVLDNELKAGNAMVCVDLDANYQHLCLGDTFKIDKDNYLVTRVECKVDEKDSLETTMATEQGITFVKKAELKHTKNLHFYVYGIKQTNANTASTAEFYPPMLSSGHARLVSPQIAIVKETFDPQKNARYRIQYPWQTDKEYSPWLPVSHEMMFKNAGSVWNLEKETVVLLDYKDGNVERPYIVGAMQTETNQASRATLFNKMDLCSPAGHAIRLTDGYGAGAANFIANFNPLVSWCKAWCPDGSAWHNESGSWEDYKYYEGGITLTDKYGIYSIKTSTDERNISIKSPYGDVNLSAFTGITISAPNGDVRIAGKNVSIEAGNNLSIVSGKNIANGLLGSGVLMGRSTSGSAVVTDIAKAFGNKAVSALDISLLRDVFEVFVRPIAGELTIKSNRQMLIQAGIDEDEFNITSRNQKGDAADNWWKKNLIDECYSLFSLRSSSAWSTEENGKIVVKCKKYSGADENTIKKVLGNNSIGSNGALLGNDSQADDIFSHLLDTQSPIDQLLEEEVGSSSGVQILAFANHPVKAAVCSFISFFTWPFRKLSKSKNLHDVGEHNELNQETISNNSIDEGSSFTK